MLNHQKKNIQNKNYNFFNVQINLNNNIFFINLPLSRLNQYCFQMLITSGFVKSNCDIITNLYIPHILTNTEYKTDYYDDNYFYQNIELKKKNQIGLTNQNKQNLYKFNINSNCLKYGDINFLPFIKNQIINWAFMKYKILAKNKINNISDFIKYLKLKIINITCFSENIQIKFNIQIVNLDSKYDNLDKLSETANFYVKFFDNTQQHNNIPNNNTRIMHPVLNYNYVVSDNINYITKLNVGSNFKIYVDKKTPEMYYVSIQNTIANLNNIFEIINNTRPFIIILPTHNEYPNNFNKHDMQYSSIKITDKYKPYWGLMNYQIQTLTGEITWFQIRISLGQFCENKITINNTSILLDDFITDKHHIFLNHYDKIMKKIKNINYCYLPKSNIINIIDYNQIIQKILLHELGHCLGLTHVYPNIIQLQTSTQKSIMDNNYIISSIEDNNEIINWSDYDNLILKYGYKNLPCNSVVKTEYLNNIINEIKNNNYFINSNYFNQNIDSSQTTIIDMYINIELNAFYEKYQNKKQLLLSQVTTNIITKKDYVTQLINYYQQIMVVLYSQLTNYLGDVIYNVQLDTYHILSRKNSCQLLQNMIRFIGNYNDSQLENINIELKNNILNWEFNLTDNEQLYINYNAQINSDILLQQIQSNITYQLYTLLLSYGNRAKIDKYIKINNIPNFNYNICNLFQNAPHMKFEEIINIIAFSPGCNVTNFYNNNICQGTPWLYYTHIRYFESYRKITPQINSSGFCDVNDLQLLPYPISQLPSFILTQTQIPKLYSYYNPGLFPEITMFRFKNANDDNNKNITLSQCLIYLEIMPKTRIVKRIVFMNWILNIITTIKSKHITKNNQIINVINNLINIIWETYHPEINNSKICMFNIIKKSVKISQNVKIHVNEIYNLANQIKQKINQLI